MLLERLLSGVRAHDDERNVFGIRIAFQLVADREPVHARQLDRQQNQVWAIAGCDLQAGIRILDNRRFGAETTKTVLQLFGESWITLKNQNLHGDPGRLLTTSDRQGVYSPS